MKCAICEGEYEEKEMRPLCGSKICKLCYQRNVLADRWLAIQKKRDGGG